MVVDHIGQVIGGIAVRFQQHKIIQGAVFKDYFTAQQVLEFGLPFQRSFKADHRFDALGCQLRPVGLGQVAAVPVIAGRQLLFLLLRPHGFQPFG